MFPNVGTDTARAAALGRLTELARDTCWAVRSVAARVIRGHTLLLVQMVRGTRDDFEELRRALDAQCRREGLDPDETYVLMNLPLGRRNRRIPWMDDEILRRPWRETDRPPAEAGEAVPEGARGFALRDVPGVADHIVRVLDREGIVTLGEVLDEKAGPLSMYRGVGPKVLAAWRKRLSEFLAEVRTFPPEVQADAKALRDAFYTRKPFVRWVLDVADVWPTAWRTVADGRLFPAGTLVPAPQVAASLGFTPRQVSRITTRAWNSLGRHIAGLVRYADDRIVTARWERTAPLHVDDLEAADPWFEGVARHSAILRTLLSRHHARHRLSRTDPVRDCLVPAALPTPPQWARACGLPDERVLVAADLAQIARAFTADYQALELASVVAEHLRASV